MQENSHYRQLNAACCKFEKTQKIILVAINMHKANFAKNMAQRFQRLRLEQIF